VKGMSDEQLAEAERQLARKVRSEAAKDARLNQELPDEPAETDDPS
jgi:hypothetical protein